MVNKAARRLSNEPTGCDQSQELGGRPASSEAIGQSTCKNHNSYDRTIRRINSVVVF